MSNKGPGMSHLQRMFKRLDYEMAGKLKDQPEKFPRNPETGLPEPKNFKEMLATVEDLVRQHKTVYTLIAELQEALPKEEGQDDPTISADQFMSQFLTGNPNEEYYRMVFAVNPMGIALLSLNDFFSDENRFVMVSPQDLPFYANLMSPYLKDKISHTSIDLGGKTTSAPVNNEFWFEDTVLKSKFIVKYAPVQGGQVSVNVYSSYENDELNAKFSNEIKLSVLQSPFIKGQVIEITEGSGFNIVDLGEQPYPIISEELSDELEKNVISLFGKAEEFKKLGQAVSRKIILSGGPGNGKTMIGKYLASRLRGQVTTIWVSAKSILERDHIDEIFEIARKLSPALIIMEDLDLISGTRSMFGNDNMLGEMLNQLDGLKKNDSIVIVASTNRVEDLDEALNDRPERFDRIFEVGKPTGVLAQKIAHQYLIKKCNVSEATVNDLNLSRYFKDHEFSGAQVIEVIRGAIFESVHRGCEINEMCLKSSKEGLEKQRKLIQKKQKREE